VKKFFLGIVPALLTTLFLWPVSASAQAVDVTVSPVSLDYSPKPGDIIRDKVAIHNNSNSPINFKLSVDNMTVDEQGNVVPAEIPATSSAAGWISFNTSAVTAPAREWLDVPFTITVPADAAYGNYFALVFSPPSPQAGGGTASVQGNILVPILINVKKEGALAQAAITEFGVKNFVTQFLPVDFTVKLKNTGNIHVRPRGNIFIRGSGAKDLAVLEVNQGLGSILPEATRTFETGWTDGFPVRDATGRLDFNWNKLTSFRLGKYTAHLLLVYDDGQRDIPLESDITFWVFPYTAVATILVIIIATVFIITYAFKTLVKREAGKIQKT
jgi:hypothetical protein